MMMRFGYLIMVFLLYFSCNEKKVDKRETNIKINNEFPQFHKGHNLWTGNRVENDIQYVCGVEFDFQDSLSIDYRLTYLEDWIQKKEIFGTALLSKLPPDNSLNIISNSDTFEVFCFNDTTNNFRILFTRNADYPPMLAKVQYLYNKIWVDTTMVMHQK